NPTQGYRRLGGRESIVKSGRQTDANREESRVNFRNTLLNTLPERATESKRVF
ncbi:hypothetical protein EZS27_037788, partial [termite gut metagenome]